MRIERKNLRGVSLRGISLPRIDLRGGGDNPQDWAGYPLELDVPSARTLRNYTIFGNTSEDAKGVGDEVVNLAYGGNISNATTVNEGNNIILITPTASPSRCRYTADAESAYISTSAEHKYFVSVRVKADLSLGRVRFINYQISNPVGHIDTTTSEWETIYGIITETQDRGSATIQIYSVNTAPYRVRRDTFVCIDLTEMFGAGNEPATADEFAQRLGYADAAHLPAFPYGSSFVAPIRVGSRNLWDEEWEVGGIDHTTGENTTSTRVCRSKNYIKVEPNKDYYFACDALVTNISLAFIHYYGENKQLISYLEINATRTRIFRTPAGTAYVRFNTSTYYGATYGNDICINLSDEHNGEYSPYFAPTLYPSVLSSPLHKIGDIVDYKESNGKEWHAFVEKKLKDLNWSYNTSFFGEPIFFTLIDGIKAFTKRSICPPYNLFTGDLKLMPNKCFTTASGAQGYIYIRDLDYTTAAEFKAHFTDEDMLVYELATPTEVQGEPLPRLAIPKGESIVTLDTAVEPSNITARV